MKFTPAGGRVTLDAALRDGPPAIDVSDRGLGILEREQHRVFGLLERLHEAEHPVGGTGLGLALTKNLLEAMRGSVEFESRKAPGPRCACASRTSL